MLWNGCGHAAGVSAGIRPPKQNAGMHSLEAVLVGVVGGRRVKKKDLPEPEKKWTANSEHTWPKAA